MPADGAFELRVEQRNALLAPPPVADRVLHGNAPGCRAAAEKHLDGVCDRTLARIQVVARERGVFNDLHPEPERIDPGIGRRGILVVPGRKRTLDQPHGHHVLEAMVAVRRVGERPGLVDDPPAALLRLDRDPLHLCEPRGDLWVEGDRGLDRRLRVEFGGIGDLEEDVLHHVAPEALGRDREGLAPKDDVLEPPDLGGQGPRVPHLAPERQDRMQDAPACGIARGPALARARVGGMAVGPERAAVEKRVRERVHDLIAGSPEQAIRTSSTWSSPTRLNAFSRARTPWISCAWTIATSRSRTRSIPRLPASPERPA